MVGVVDDRVLDGSPEPKLRSIGIARHAVICDWQPKEKGDENLMVNITLL